MHKNIATKNTSYLIPPPYLEKVNNFSRDITYVDLWVSIRLCTGQFQNRPCTPPPPGQTPGHLTFKKNFGQIPRYVASSDGQMPHPLELQRGSNPPPSRHVKQTVETSSAKFSATTNFLYSWYCFSTRGFFGHNLFKFLFSPSKRRIHSQSYFQS